MSESVPPPYGAGLQAETEPMAPETNRLDENDLDLLTFTEAAIRLDQATIDTTKELARLQAGSADEAVIGRLERRLADLAAARQRPRRPASDG